MVATSCISSKMPIFFIKVQIISFLSLPTKRGLTSYGGTSFEPTVSYERTKVLAESARGVRALFEFKIRCHLRESFIHDEY